MNDEQKALIVRDGPDGARGLDVLNEHLKRGWRVRHVAPMGGAGTGAGDASARLAFAALVVIERSEHRAETAVAAAEEEVEEIIDEVVDGNGPAIPVKDLDVETS
jgi:hypothetical protein